MQGDIDSLPGRLGVVAIEIEERIKCRRWIRIQERIPQPRLADRAYRQILPLVSGITETRFPVPSLEIIAKFAHLTTEPDVEKGIPVGDLVMCGTGIVDAAKENPGVTGDRDSVNHQ